MNQTSAKVDFRSQRMKIDKFILKKIVLDTVRGDQLLYIPFRFDYKFSS